MPNPKDDPKSPEWRPYIFARDLAADLSAPKFDDNAIWSRFCELVAARVHLLTSGGPLTGSLVPIRTIE